MSEITLNGQRALSARVRVPWRGVPFVDVDLDPDVVATAAAAAQLGGPAVIFVDGIPPTTITGVIDPSASGTFVASARMRVTCGAGGWEREIPGQDFPVALASSAVYGGTGALVLEKVTVLAPTVFERFTRSQGPASRVFADDVEWWVDTFTGVTFVGPRPPAVPDPSLEILEWDPTTKTALVACDALVQPGTPLIDPRIGESPVIVRDVDQLFGREGSRATCRCSEQRASRLATTLSTLVRELSGVTYPRLRRYRFIVGTSTLALQAVDRDPITQAGSPLPDVLAINESSGMAGVRAILTPGTEVTVGFRDGDASQPIVLAYSTSTPPISLSLDAVANVSVGELALLVSLAGGLRPIAGGDWSAYLTAALATFAAACTTPAALPAAAAALATALVPLPSGPMPLPALVRVKGT